MRFSPLDSSEHFMGRGGLRFFLQRSQCPHCNRCISYSNPSVCPSVRVSVRQTTVLCQNDGMGPGSRPHCARWGSSSPSSKRGQSPHFAARAYCGQTVSFGTAVGFAPGHIVLDGDPAPLPKKGQRPPIFSPFVQRAAMLALQTLY